MRRADRKAAIERYAASRRALFEHNIADCAAGIDCETPEFRRLNRAAWAAEDGVPRWRRRLIDRRILRELDYWRQVGQ